MLSDFLQQVDPCDAVFIVNQCEKVQSILGSIVHQVQKGDPEWAERRKLVAKAS